ncbi:hybrid sensor histidine kinase/response regulator [Sabulicella glaciei]|nr:ATP-binding protein [Roseococcus sp. MDT2-1-1]
MAGMRFRTHLVLLVAGALLPVLGLSAALLWREGEEARRAALETLSHQAQAFGATVDREIAGTVRALESAALAIAPAETASPEALRPRLEAMLARNPRWHNMILVRPDGRLALNTLAGPGEALPAASPAPRIAEAAVGRTAISDPFVGSVAQVPLVSVAVPLPAAPGWVLVAAIRTHSFEAVIEEALPPGSLAGLIGANGRFVAHSSTPQGDRTAAPAPRAMADFAATAAPGEVMLTTTQRVTGERVIAVARRLQVAPWTVSVAAPEAVLHKQAGDSLHRLATLGAAALLAALLAAFLAGRHLGRRVHALTRAAEAAGRGEVVRVPAGVAEVDRVAAVLAEAASTVRAREEEARRAGEERARLALEARTRDELRRLNAGLEARVREEVAAREAAQRRAAHAERMQALGQLAGGIAHDFNNVLQAVQGGASLIERRPDDPDGVRRLARMVLEATGRGVTVTRRLLSFARRDELRAEPVEAGALLAGLCEVLTHTLGDGVRCSTEAPPGLPALLADKGQLETVLVNLATNARDAMPEGGTLRFVAAAETVTPDAPHPLGLAPGGYVRVAVSDTGTGMDAATLARVSEPFFTTKPEGRGTGLGLSMARGFAEQSGGAMAVESAPGHGTTVTLWLPEADIPSPMPAARPEAVRPAQARPGRHVLLVDDNDVVRLTVSAELEAAGFQTACAADAAQALSLMEAGVVVDVLVTDLSMPGASGLALIHEAQARRPGLPAILLTGYAGDGAALAVGGAISGAFSLIRKPVSGPHLAERVEALIAARGAISQPEG